MQISRFPDRRPGRCQSGAQAIADPGLGQNVVRPLGIGLDLVPQLPHVDPQILRIGQVVPQFAEQELVGQHLAGMLHEHTQQLVLLGRQLHLLVRDLDDTAHEVDRQIARPKNRAFAVHLQLMPQRRPHAGEQLVHAERFGDVIVGAEVERLDLPGFVAPT